MCFFFDFLLPFDLDKDLDLDLDRDGDLFDFFLLCLDVLMDEVRSTCTGDLSFEAVAAKAGEWFLLECSLLDCPGTETTPL